MFHKLLAFFCPVLVCRSHVLFDASLVCVFVVVECRRLLTMHARAFRSASPLTGQYGTDAAGVKEAYLSHADVPKGSTTPTFATAVMYINNSRWYAQLDVVRYYFSMCFSMLLNIVGNVGTECHLFCVPVKR